MFQAIKDGYSLLTIYEYAKRYLENEDQIDEDFDANDSYHYCLVLVETSTGHTFGAFLSAFPQLVRGQTFVGTVESFAFMFKE